MKTPVFAIAVGTLVAVASQSAAGVTILDLDNATAGTALDGPTTFTEDGYLLEWGGFGEFPTFFDTGSNIAIQDGTPGLPDLGSVLRISRVDGQPFDFVGLDVANLGTGLPFSNYNLSIVANATTLQFQPAVGAGFVTETITDPAFSNVTNVEINLFTSRSFPGAGFASFVADNFQVIPTPGAAGLLAVAGLAAARRRR